MRRRSILVSLLVAMTVGACSGTEPGDTTPATGTTDTTRATTVPATEPIGTTEPPGEPSTTVPDGATDDTADDTTDNTTDGAVTSTTPCRRVTVVDEYGFPIDVDDCGDVAVLDAQAEVADLPDGPTRDGLGAALRAAEQLGTRCHEPGRWAELATATADGLHQVVLAVEAQATADPTIADWIGSPAAYTVLDRIVTDATDSTCPAGTAGTTTVDATAIAAAGRLSGAIDDLSSVLDVVDNLGIAGEFWFQSDQVGHTVDLLELGPDAVAAIDVLALGPSTVKRGLDTALLTELTGRRSYNAAVGALAVDLQASWYEATRSLGLAPTTVVVGLNPWIEFEACPNPQRNRVLAADERRATAYTTVAGVGAVDAATRFAGGAGQGVPPTYSSRLLDNYRAAWREGGGGVDTVSDTPEPEIEQLQVEQFLDQPITELCPDRLERTAALLARIAADVDDLVVVALPTSDRMVALHPDGIAAHTDVVERYRAMAEAAGGRFVDRSAAAPQEWFVDLTHLGATGREAFTTDLAELLAEAP